MKCYDRNHVHSNTKRLKENGKVFTTHIRKMFKFLRLCWSLSNYYDKTNEIDVTFKCTKVAGALCPISFLA